MIQRRFPDQLVIFVGHRNDILGRTLHVSKQDAVLGVFLTRFEVVAVHQSRINSVYHKIPLQILGRLTLNGLDNLAETEGTTFVLVLRSFLILALSFVEVAAQGFTNYFRQLLLKAVHHCRLRRLTSRLVHILSSHTRVLLQDLLLQLLTINLQTNLFERLLPTSFGICVIYSASSRVIPLAPLGSSLQLSEYLLLLFLLLFG